jgi:outer membrane protein assembly factor BamB
MSETITIIPSQRGPGDLVYVEHIGRRRSLHVLMQDTATRDEGTRHGFLAAAFRDVVARYQSTARIERAYGYLRHTVRALDDLSLQVETRVDDLRGLGIYLLVEEADAFYLLCARDASVRVRVEGTFVALHGSAATRAPHGAQEVAVETARAQHDLFTPTLPETLALYRIPRAPEAGGHEFLLGGSSSDLAAALDAIDARRGAATITSDRLTRTMLYLRFDATHAAPHAGDARAARGAGRHAWLRAATAAVIVVGGAIGIGVFASRLDLERKPAHSSATTERPTPVMARETSEPEHVAEAETATAPIEQKAERTGFAVAWEQAYSEPVTSSPALLGEGIVFGSRDGRVYMLDRDDGTRVWSHVATGGVGASPVVRDDAVIVADYGGNVYRLARGDGRTSWKRALREKVVSTPACTDERVAVGTVRGNVYALSLETGRVLWRFATRGQVRGGIAHARTTFFVPSHDGRLYALDENTGRKRWSVALGGPVASTPFADGTRVVIGNTQGKILAYEHATGKKVWSYATRGAVNSGILVQDGRVYAGSTDRRVYCLDAATGELVWSFETSGAVLSRPFVDANRVVVTSYDGAVYALDAKTGEQIDRYGTEDDIFSSPFVVDDRVFFGTNGGRFLCLNLRGS